MQQQKKIQNRIVTTRDITLVEFLYITVQNKLFKIINKMSLQSLLEAARVIEQRDNTNQYSSLGSRKERKFTKRSQTYRATHNQLEKNRRAHLRDCLISLRDLVPNSPDTTKVTTLSLLQSAKQYIKVLETHDSEAVDVKRKLSLEQQHLRKRLAQLLNSFDIPSDALVFKSESSTCSNDDEIIDVENDDETGYGSDDRNSFSSNSSLNSVL